MATMESVALLRTTEQFHALADPTRLAILFRLRQRDQCVCHLVEDLGLKQSVVSHHVGILRRAGLIQSYPHASDRRWLYYQMNRVEVARLHEHIGMLLDETEYNPIPLPCAADMEERKSEFLS